MVGLGNCGIAVGFQPMVQIVPILPVIETIPATTAFTDVPVNLVKQFRAHGIPYRFGNTGP
jgi:hypothetical protein